MTRRRLCACLLAACMAALVLGPAPAVAAPPANDVFSGAEVVTALPFSTAQDTTEATTDADDAAINNRVCFGSATEASVWYAFTPDTSGVRVFSVAGTDYPAGVAVATGTPGSFLTAACGPSEVTASLEAGTTYSILVFDFAPGEGNGGNLQFSITDQLPPPPPPTLSVTIDPVGYASRTGTATITGSFACTDAPAVRGFLTLTQQVGRIKITGTSDPFAPMTPCDGETHPFAQTITSPNGRFAGGKAVLTGFVLACVGERCAHVDIGPQTVKLNARR